MLAAYKPRELLEHRNNTTISSEDLKIIKLKSGNIYINIMLYRKDL
nr:MAG TPA: hypothetical protein [Caudoviricetes sp.]